MYWTNNFRHIKVLKRGKFAIISHITKSVGHKCHHQVNNQGNDDLDTVVNITEHSTAQNYAGARCLSSLFSFLLKLLHVLNSPTIATRSVLIGMLGFSLFAGVSKCISESNNKDTPSAFPFT